jgi:hypothetical protein
MYGHGNFSAALGFAPQRLTDALWYMVLIGSPLVCASFVGGCTLSALTLAPLVWPRKYILVGILVEGVLVAAGSAILSPHLHAFRQQWSTVGLELAVCATAGVCVLALPAADIWKQRSADSLLLALWVLGTFVFTAFLNWTINARSVLPLIPAAGILLARRLDTLGIASVKRLQAEVALALLASGLLSFWIAQADADWANSAKQAAFVLRQRTRNETGTVWFQGHWGFQYYMEQLGMPPFDYRKSTFSGRPACGSVKQLRDPGVAPAIHGL